MLNQLKSVTRPYHDRLDSLPCLQRLLAADLNPSEYFIILEKFYGLYQPLEARLEGLLDWTRWGLDFEQRRKAPRLAADLKAFGLDPSTLPRACALPRLEDEADAWGVQYVLEGASLGGQVIARQLRRSLGLSAEGLSFFQGHGTETAAQWQVFRGALQNWATTHSQDARIFTAACSGFQAFEDWLSRSSAPHAAERQPYA